MKVRDLVSSCEHIWKNGLLAHNKNFRVIIDTGIDEQSFNIWEDETYYLFSNEEVYYWHMFDLDHLYIKLKFKGKINCKKVLDMI